MARSISKTLVSLGIAGAMVVATGSALVSQVFADDANHLQKVSDNFENLYLKPDAKAKWWIINWGPNSDSTQGRWEAFCGTASCVNEQQEGDDGFVRLSTFPQPISGFFNNAEIAELHTGFPSEATGKWTPTVGHPIEVKSRVRWSGQYNQSGSGGAVGTNGVWMWNSPYDLANYNPLATVTAFGFNWAPSDSFGGYLAGLKTVAFQDNNPVWIERPTNPVNMQDWNTFRFLWEVDANGHQTITSWINDDQIGSTQLATPMHNLSLEIWSDNEKAVFDQTGLHIQYSTLPSTQNFDVSSVSVKQLGND